MIKLFEVQFKICTLREMHMLFQYIKCWLVKEFNKLDKINKKSRCFLCFFVCDLYLWDLNSSRNKIHQGFVVRTYD